jgi:4-amino-4-deoxy-L-arabinose transferase-like glycosyltransferase
MKAKKILAGIFAVLILVKLAALLVIPGKWMSFGRVFLEHHLMATWIYVVLLAITGYFIFSGLNLIDIALVMFFTSLLTGLTLLPYSAQMVQLGDAMTATGFGKAWLSLVIWGAVAVAVIFKVFSRGRT